MTAPRLQQHLGATVILLALLIASPAGAQHVQEGTVLGVTTDPSGAALRGVTFVATSPRLIGGAKTTVSDEAGRYRFPLLPPGTYEIEAALVGFKTIKRSAVVVPPGFAITVDFELPLASIPETVVVQGGLTPLDVRSSASPTLIDRVLLDNLPLDRNVADYINLAPGVVRNVALGGSAFANPIALDGASGNEPGWGTPSTPLTRAWIDEIQIVGAGADAQYGEFTGALLNAITRSGGNRLSGLGEFWGTRQRWADNNRGTLPADLRAQFRPIEILQRWEATAQVGGPVAIDRLWFFTGVQRHRNDNRPAAFSTRPRTNDEPKSANTAHSMIGKLTAALSRSIRLEGFYAHTTTRAVGVNASPLIEPEAMANNDRRDGTANVRFTWMLGPQTFGRSALWRERPGRLVRPPARQAERPPCTRRSIYRREVWKRPEFR